MAHDVFRALEAWFQNPDEAWTVWNEGVTEFRTLIGHLLGLPANSIVPKTSAGQGLRAVLNTFDQAPIEVVATACEFDSVDHILRTYESKGRITVRWVEPESHSSDVPRLRSRLIQDAIQRQTQLVVVPHVLFQTGQILDNVSEIAARAQEVGALTVLDTYHSFGVLPFTLAETGFDFAIGGSYKYVRGGPGACWLAIHPRVFDRGLRTLDTGWFAKADPFHFQRNKEIDWATNGDGWLESTPPVVTAFQALAGLELLVELGVDRLRATSLSQQRQLRETFRTAGVQMFEPEDPNEFGAFSLLPYPNGSTLTEKLSTLDVCVDSRGPFVRFGPDILNTQTEFNLAAERTAAALREPSDAI
jgi:kynureninase